MLERLEAVSLASACTFDLGLHILEVLEDQSVLIVDHTMEKEAVQLDQEERYRLFVA